nr:MAG TPA: hypothetical protein [Caudoviricetes sp.]
MESYHKGCRKRYLVFKGHTQPFFYNLKQIGLVNVPKSPDAITAFPLSNISLLVHIYM